MIKRSTLLTFLLITFIDWMGVGLIYPLFSTLIYSENSSLVSPDTPEAVKGTWLGLLLATMPITLFFSSPWLGAWSDRAGRKKALKLGLSVSTLGYFIGMLGIAYQQLSIIFLSRVFVGIGAGTTAVVSAAVSDLSSPENKARYFGLLSMSFGFGFAVGPFLGGLLADVAFGPICTYQCPFLMAVIINLISLLLVIPYTPETNKIDNPTISMPNPLSSIAKAFKAKQMKFLFISVFLFCSGWSFFWEFIPVTWMVSYSFDAATIGMYYGYGALFYAFSCAFLIPIVLHRFTPEKTIYYSLISCGFAIGLMAFNPHSMGLLIFIPIQQFIISLLYPVAAALVSRNAPKESQGEMMGVFQAVESLAFALSPLIAGPFLGLSHYTPLIFGSLTMFLAAQFMKRYIRSPHSCVQLPTAS